MSTPAGSELLHIGGVRVRAAMGRAGRRFGPGRRAAVQVAGRRRPGHRPGVAPRARRGRRPEHPERAVTWRRLQLNRVSMPTPLPPVERLRPGLWSVPVPIPSNSLRYVFVYVFETDAGPYLVDTGWNPTKRSLPSPTAGPRSARRGQRAGRARHHIHPDHYGLAGGCEESGAWGRRCIRPTPP